MVKVRIVGMKDTVEFSDRNEAFDWVRRTQRPNTLFSLLSYDLQGSLESLDRFTFTGGRFLMENILR